MDADVLSYLDFLQNNVFELRQLGKGWGMTEEEVSLCIKKVIGNGVLRKPEPTSKSLGRQVWSWIRFSFKLSLVIFAVIVTAILSVYVAASVSQDVEMATVRALQPYGYAIFRNIRLATLPIHDLFNITQFYDAECIVTNPYFTEPEVDCVYCEGLTALMTFQTLNHSLAELLINNRQPLIHQGGYPTTVTYKHLREMYMQNKDAFDGELQQIESTNEMVKSLPDLFDNDLEGLLNTTESLVIKWFSRGVKSSNLLRNLFPRPEVIPPNTEVALLKTVYLDGPSSHHYEVERGKFPQSVYIQTSGVRKAVLRPRDSCENWCQLFTVTLKEADILLYDHILWKLFLLPNVDGTSVGLSLSYST